MPKDITYNTLLIDCTILHGLNQILQIISALNIVTKQLCAIVLFFF